MAYNKITGEYEGFIYMFTNKVNDKKYVGQTVTTIEHRVQQHFSKKNRKRKYAINLAIDKYGEENFDIKEIEKLSCKTKEELKELLNKKEVYYIKEFHSHYTEHGYNIDKGGANCTYFSKPIDVYDLNTKQLVKSFDSMHEASRYYNIDVTTISKICRGDQNRSNKHNLIFRFKGEAFDKYDTSKILPYAKKIYQYTLDGEFVNEYISAGEASRCLDNIVVSGCISRAARLNKTAGGFVWSYEKEFNFDINNYRNYVSVDKYTTDGKFLGNYKSATEAGNSLNLGDHVRTSWITDVCSGKSLTAYGYVWRYKNEPFNLYRIESKSHRKINQYTTDDIFVETHDSALSASKCVNLKYSGDISKCCKGKQKTCGGFKWFYSDDPNQPDKSKIITNNVA